MPNHIASPSWLDHGNLVRVRSDARLGTVVHAETGYFGTLYVVRMLDGAEETFARDALDVPLRE